MLAAACGQFAKDMQVATAEDSAVQSTVMMLEEVLSSLAIWNRHPEQRSTQHFNEMQAFVTAAVCPPIQQVIAPNAIQRGNSLGDLTLTTGDISRWSRSGTPTSRVLSDLSPHPDTASDAQEFGAESFLLQPGATWTLPRPYVWAHGTTMAWFIERRLHERLRDPQRSWFLAELSFSSGLEGQQRIPLIMQVNIKPPSSFTDGTISGPLSVRSRAID
ncbi:hypothetical protein AC579_10057 [Pseudocercospora musae]|uniref:Uncharacterized protein n=1 Tax=Pseudocercospora musae TaxID=113226 RepID=A0A139I6C5_9PEZI|nr:hypothetical protein AC579_10057 [Pseudocercospora musae]